MLTITRTACKSYDLESDSMFNSFTVKDLAGATVASDSFSNGPVQFQLAEEGVYIVQENIPDEDPVYYTLIEECELIACLMNLMMKLFCGEPGKCADCEDTSAALIRHELLKLMAGYGMYMAMVFAERVTYYNIMHIDDCRMQKLQAIEKWLDDLKAVKTRCGPDDCLDNSNPETSDCPSC